MDEIALRRRPDGRVRIVVNGLALVEHCAESVRSNGRKAMRDARDFVDVDLSHVDPVQHFFGRSDHVWSSPFDDDDEPTEYPILLECTCGIDVCSPLPAEISVGDTSVTWDFAAAAEGRGLRIGPFEFSLGAYRHHVEGLVRDV